MCRTPFKIHRAPLEELATSMGSLGTRLRAMSLGADPEQAAPGSTKGKKLPAEGSLQRGPVLLILDEHLQCLPWESLPALRSQRSVSNGITLRTPSQCSTCLRLRSCMGVSTSSVWAAVHQVMESLQPPATSTAGMSVCP